MTKGRIRSKLWILSGDAFANEVEVLMGVLSPRVAQSRRLGDLDRQGIDVFIFDDTSMRVEIAVQCKGYERPFESDMIAGLVEEVGKFGRMGPIVEEYWLVVNRPIQTEHRPPILEGLTALEASGRCRTAKLLDVNELEKMLSREAQIRVRDWVGRFRERMANDYRERMAFTRYLPDVTYAHDGGMHTNPSQMVLREIREFLAAANPSSAGPSRYAPHFLLTASFGFGKTTMLHEIAAEWFKGGGSALYLPAAALPNEVFHSVEVGLETLLPMIAPEDEEIPEDLGLHIMRKAWKKLARREEDFLILIDAVDESDFWDDPERLSALWSLIWQLGAPAVVSVREEVYHSRTVEFTYPSGHRKGRPFFERISLVEWDGEMIGAFLDSFARERNSEPSEGYVKLRKIVAAGEYERVFGDIPRRPLFLGMLAEDAWESAEPERRLDRLYERYVRKKVEHDRYSASAGGRAVRLGSVFRRHGEEEAAERLLRAMTSIALELLDRDHRGNGVRREFSEATLRQHVVAELGDYDRIEEITLNSLIMPAGRRDAAGRRIYRFAHKSFQDWFAARGLFTGQSHIPEVLPVSVRYFLEMMQSDGDARLS